MLYTKIKAVSISNQIIKKELPLGHCPFCNKCVRKLKVLWRPSISLAMRK